MLETAAVREKVLAIIKDVALDDDVSQLQDNVGLRDQLDLDSMDFLDIVMELKKRHQIDVPKEDYGRLESMASCVEYLQPKFKH